jgi:hypothetical protein
VSLYISPPLSRFGSSNQSLLARGHQKPPPNYTTHFSYGHKVHCSDVKADMRTSSASNPKMLDWLGHLPLFNFSYKFVDPQTSPKLVQSGSGELMSLVYIYIYINIYMYIYICIIHALFPTPASELHLFEQSGTWIKRRHGIHIV